MKARSGFSLIELVVVMLVAAILVAVAVPSMNDPEIRASWYYEQVKAGVRYAQRQAVAQRRSIFVVVEAEQVRLCYDALCGTPLPRITDGQSYVLPVPGDMELTPATVSFNGLGQPDGAGTLNIGGQVITITPETGYVL